MGQRNGRVIAEIGYAQWMYEAGDSFINAKQQFCKQLLDNNGPVVELFSFTDEYEIDFID